MNKLISHIENLLSQTLNDTKIPNQLIEAMRYAVLNGGKRIRPLLMYATGECFGADTHSLDASATAIELIHCYSLVHDDLPAMDNDDLRRGKLTTHKAFNEATAILAGDALQTMAFEVLTKHNSHYSSKTQLKLIAILANASGGNGMVGGQMLDLESEGQTLSEKAIQNIHSLKTGKLIHAAVMMAALIANCNSTQMKILNEFASEIGLLFQLKDDLLDAESITQHLGKTAGLDKKNKKAAALISTTTIKKYADALLNSAKQHLSQLPGKTKQLEELTNYIFYRTN